MDHAWVEENGVRLRVPIGAGQKTGWFYDQAANRHAFLKYIKGARVLDVFSYLGAWGLAAARAGAHEVLCVDSSAPALELLQESAAANELEIRTQRGDAFDVLAALREAGERFDVVVVDPPAFIKRRRDIPKGQADGPTDTEAFRAYVQAVLSPTLRNGDVVILDNLSPHKSDGTLELIKERGAEVRFLPAYSPDFNPIELMWSKVKASLRSAEARTQSALNRAVATALAAVTAQDARNWFAHCGYSFI